MEYFFGINMFFKDNSIGKNGFLKNLENTESLPAHTGLQLS